MTIEIGQRAQEFTSRYGLKMPVLMAPMAGACPPELAAAVARVGAMGAVGSLLDNPEQIAEWVARFRAGAPDGQSMALQMNLWVPDPLPVRNPAREASVRKFLATYGPPVAEDAFDPSAGPEFTEQFAAFIQAGPTVVSSIMGLYPAPLVQQLKDAGISWFACVTTVEEARQAQAAGADAVVAQGAEAGGHRGAFTAANGREQSVGLFALLPQVVDAVDVPVIATGGISDARTVAAAMMLGASAVQIGTGLLRSDESGVPPAWANGLKNSAPERTRLTRAFSGRWGRALASDYVLAANAPNAPEPAQYPVQRAFTGAMRKAAMQAGDVQRMQAWAGQCAALAQSGPAAQLVQSLWAQACELLGIDA